MSAPSPDRAAIRFVDIDGVRLRTSVRGTGPPLLLITGLGASLDLARPFERRSGVAVTCADTDVPAEATPAPLGHSGRRFCYRSSVVIGGLTLPTQKLILSSVVL